MTKPSQRSHRLDSLQNPWWDPTDVLSFLEVLPEERIEPHVNTYRLARGPLRLELTIAYYDRVVDFALFHEADDIAIFELVLHYCDGIRYINDKRGEYLEFGPGQVSADMEPQLVDWPYTIRLNAKHRLAIRIGKS